MNLSCGHVNDPHWDLACSTEPYVPAGRENTAQYVMGWGAMMAYHALLGTVLLAQDTLTMDERPWLTDHNLRADPAAAASALIVRL